MAPSFGCCCCCCQTGGGFFARIRRSFTPGDDYFEQFRASLYFVLCAAVQLFLLMGPLIAYNVKDELGVLGDFKNQSADAVQERLGNLTKLLVNGTLSRLTWRRAGFNNSAHYYNVTKTLRADLDELNALKTDEIEGYQLALERTLIASIVYCAFVLINLSVLSSCDCWLGHRISRLLDLAVTLALLGLTVAVIPLAKVTFNEAAIDQITALIVTAAPKHLSAFHLVEQRYICKWDRTPQMIIDSNFVPTGRKTLPACVAAIVDKMPGKAIIIVILVTFLIIWLLDFHFLFHCFSRYPSSAATASTAGSSDSEMLLPPELADSYAPQPMANAMENALDRERHVHMSRVSTAEKQLIAAAANAGRRTSAGSSNSTTDEMEAGGGGGAGGRRQSSSGGSQSLPVSLMDLHSASDDFVDRTMDTGGGDERPLISPTSPPLRTVSVPGGTASAAQHHKFSIPTVTIECED